MKYQEQIWICSNNNENINLVNIKEQKFLTEDNVKVILHLSQFVTNEGKQNDIINEIISARTYYTFMKTIEHL